MSINFESLIKKDRPNIKDNSLKSYLIILKKLNKNKALTTMSFLKDYDNIIEKLEKLALTTRRNYLSSILVILRAYNKKSYDGVLDKYKKLLAELNEQYNLKINSHEKSDKQKENWMELSELKKGLKLYKNQIKDRDIKDKEKLNKTDLDLLKKYLVVALYTAQAPVRLNYANMEIINSAKDIKPKQNYLLIKGRNKKTFVFQEYKTAKTNGRVDKIVPKELNSILNFYLKYNKSKYLLNDSKGNPITANALGKLITKAFDFTGKKVTLNLLRHIYISSNIDLDAIKKQKELATDMMHGLEMQEDYAKI
jgi:cell division protein FtsI/penicillin-binding protein 2